MWINFRRSHTHTNIPTPIGKCRCTDVLVNYLIHGGRMNEWMNVEKKCAHTLNNLNGQWFHYETKNKKKYIVFEFQTNRKKRGKNVEHVFLSILLYIELCTEINCCAFEKFNERISHLKAVWKREWEKEVAQCLVYVFLNTPPSSLRPQTFPKQFRLVRFFFCVLSHPARLSFNKEVSFYTMAIVVRGWR